MKKVIWNFIQIRIRCMNWTAEVTGFLGQSLAGIKYLWNIQFAIWIVSGKQLAWLCLKLTKAHK